MATLYLYSNLNSVFDFIGRNFIGCFEAVPERTGTRTISFLTQKLIFVTHLKLNERQRNLGLGIHPGVFSIVLSIIPKKYEKGKFPAILVKCSSGKYKFEFSDLKKYDENKHLGAFVIGEIPLSFIEEIIFMNEDEMDAFNRPSSDYWYPENKFKTAVMNEFIDTLPEDFLKTINEEELLKSAKVENCDIIKLVCNREKLRACLLNAVDATKKWLVNGYVVNIDGYLQKTFKLAKNDLTRIYIQNSNGLIPSKFKYESEIGKFSEEIIELIPIEKRNDNTKHDTIEDQLYRFVFSKFIEMQATAKHNSQELLSVIQEIEGMELFTDENDVEILRQNYRMLNGTSPLTVEQLMEFNKKYNILNAIFLVMKNPGNYLHFSQSLRSYHVEQVTARRAMVLWGVLNGLNGVSAETTYKSNQSLWGYIDAVITTLTEMPILITMPFPSNENSNEIIGLKPLCDKVVGFNDVYSYVSNTKNTLTENFYKKAMEIVRSVSADNTIDKYYSVILDTNFTARKAGTKVPKNQLIILKQNLERLLSEQPHNNFDQKQFFKDWLKNKENFIKIYQKNETYWINLYKDLMRGVKDEHL